MSRPQDGRRDLAAILKRDFILWTSQLPAPHCDTNVILTDSLNACPQLPLAVGITYIFNDCKAQHAM